MRSRVYEGVGLRSLVEGSERRLYPLMQQILQLLRQYKPEAGKREVRNRFAFAHLRVGQQMQGPIMV